jgi:hypothetical protein
MEEKGLKYVDSVARLNSHYYFAPYYVYYDLALLPVEKL